MGSGNIKNIEDSYEGERIFIIGHGPSINNTPLNKLNNEFTFGVNKTYKLFDQHAWRPTFYYTGSIPSIMHRKYNIQKIKNEIINKGTTCFLEKRLQSIFGCGKNIYYFNRFTLNNDKIPIENATIEQVKNFSLDHMYEYWSKNINNLIYEYHCMYSVLQICDYLGFDEIYLLGCDLGFEYNNPHMIFEDGLDPYRYSGGIAEYVKKSKEENALFESLINAIAYKFIDSNFQSSVVSRFLSNPDSAYFTDNYVENAEINDGKYKEKQHIKSHIVARKILEDSGINIYNATLGGKLEVYERKDIYKVINKN